MGCTKCGENNAKPNDYNFTGRVVEIKNPEQITLLRLVNVPASMGTEEDFPPKTGLYRNVVLTYDLSANIYMYLSDGVPVKLTGDLEEFRRRITKLEEYSVTETEAREAKDADLQDQIDTIKAASDVVDVVATYADLVAYDTSHLTEDDIVKVLKDESRENATTYYRWADNTWNYLGGVGPYYTQTETDKLLNAEATERKNADTALGSRIDSLSSSLADEIAAREAGDTTLQENLTTETKERKAADDAIKTDLATEKTERQNADASLLSSINAETAARKSADTTLQNNIDAETKSREDGDTALDEKITNIREDLTTETTERKAADTALGERITAEATARTNADAALQTKIEAEAKAREAGDKTNSDAIAAEAEARETADNALDEKITTAQSGLADEIAARKAADTTLQGNIDTEATTRANADTALQNALDEETDAREAADATLRADLTAETTARTAGDKTNADAIAAETTARTTTDESLQTQINAVKATADAALTPDDIDYTVVSDFALNSTTSTTTIQIDSDRVNLKTGTTSAKEIPLPVASSTQAGIMNSATFEAVASNTTNINALMNGAVAVSGLPENATQAQITAAWKEATGLASLINRASVYDTTNSKVWTYYTNTATWYAATNTTQIEIDPFTNTKAGTVKGSTSDGQVFAENDGTGSVNGWDTLKSRVATLEGAGYITENDISTLRTTVATNTTGISELDDTKADKSSLATVATSGSYNDLSNKPTIPTVNNATLTIKQNGTAVDTFTANASVDKSINITVPTKTSELTNDSNLVVDTSYVHTDNNFTAAEKTKLSGIATGAEVNVQSDWSITDTTSDAFIKNKPTIPTVPTNVSAFTNDAGYQTAANVQTAIAGKANTADLATVATTGSYNDLTNKPTIPAAITVDSALSATSTNPVQNKVINSALSGKQATLTTAQLAAANSGITAAKVSAYDGYAATIATKANSADLATVATSGKYSDLSGTPTIPTVNNATLTVQQDGTSLGTFTANSATNTTINITTPVFTATEWTALWA